MTNIVGDLTVTVIKGTKLQNQALFGVCNPYIIAKLKSCEETKTTTVKDGEPNPSWQETFTFRHVSSKDALQISLMEKLPTSDGVVSVSKPITPATWGFPGAGGAERVLDISMPAATDRVPARGEPVTSMGVVRVCLRYRAVLPYRPFLPLTLLRAAAAKTGVVTDKAKIDLVVGKVMNVVYTPVSMAGGLSKRQQLAAGGVAVVAGGGITVGVMVLSVPVVFMCLLFLPLTLMAGFFAVIMAVAFLPVALALAWVLLCSRPVQCRVWQPLVFAAVNKVPAVNKMLLSPSTAGKEQ